MTHDFLLGFALGAAAGAAGGQTFIKYALPLLQTGLAAANTKVVVPARAKLAALKAKAKVW